MDPFSSQGSFGTSDLVGNIELPPVFNLEDDFNEGPSSGTMESNIVREKNL